MAEKHGNAARPVLSLAMMVRDEERFLEDALLSARDWVDEMVVVDTGSVDRTVEIARDLGADVSFFQWVDDFSRARNETIRRSRGDWVAILDADERFRGPYPHRVRELLKPKETWPYQAISLNIVNQNLDGQVTHSFFNPRIFPRHPDLGYIGRVHNCFGSLSRGEACDFHFIQCSGLEILHLGYDQSVYTERKKFERNLTLLEAAVREEPEVARYRYYLGREYLNLNRFDEARVMLQSVIQQEHLDPLTYRETRLTYLQCLHSEKTPFEVFLAEVISVLDEHPNEVDAWYMLSLAYQDQGMTEEAISALKEGLLHIDGSDSQMGQACRLAGERAKAEIVLGQYCEQGLPPDLDQALDWYTRAWRHLSPEAPDWGECATQIIGYAIRQSQLPLLKELLLTLAERIEGVKLHHVFRLGVTNLARLDQPRTALKVAKRALAVRPSLHRDLQFVQMVQELKKEC